MKDFECETEDEIKKPFFGLIVKIMWSELHSYKGAEKFSWHTNNSLSNKINIPIGTSTFLQKFTDAHIRPPVKDI